MFLQIVAVEGCFQPDVCGYHLRDVACDIMRERERERGGVVY